MTSAERIEQARNAYLEAAELAHRVEWVMLNAYGTPREKLARAAYERAFHAAFVVAAGAYEDAKDCEAFLDELEALAWEDEQHARAWQGI